MKKITRHEIYTSIVSKYPSFKEINIDCSYKEWSNYINRQVLFNLMLEMKIHKSRHLTKKQKERVDYELKERIFKKI